MFFDNKKFYKFSNTLNQNGINIPIIPGIMIIQSISQIEKIIELSNVKLPEILSNEINENRDNPEEIKKIGIEFAKKQVIELINFGVKGLHFFPLNKSYAVSKVLENII